MEVSEYLVCGSPKRHLQEPADSDAEINMGCVPVHENQVRISQVYENWVLGSHRTWGLVMLDINQGILKLHVFTFMYPVTCNKELTQYAQPLQLVRFEDGSDIVRAYQHIPFVCMRTKEFKRGNRVSF